MRTGWLLFVAFLVVGVAGCGKSGVKVAEEAKKDVPLYDGKAGAKIGDVCINPKDGAEMVWVPAGEFLMGHDADPPQRWVDLDGYWMYKYEVTVAQYRKFCKATKREMPEAPDWGWKDDHPMVYVTWQDAADYAKWAGVSLPTEAQWEKAARGTDGRAYPWGNKWDASRCANSVETELMSAQPVGSYASGASPYGCMDMAGNVSEWCADWYDPNYYKSAPTRNPTGPSEAVKFAISIGPDSIAEFTGARVNRGGSWDGAYDGNFQCAGRCFSDPPPARRINSFGFRCARTP